MGIKRGYAAAGIGISHCQQRSDQEIPSLLTPTDAVRLLSGFSSSKAAGIHHRWKRGVVTHVLSCEPCSVCFIHELKIKALRGVPALFLNSPYPLVPRTVELLLDVFL